MATSRDRCMLDEHIGCSLCGTQVFVGIGAKCVGCRDSSNNGKSSDQKDDEKAQGRNSIVYELFDE